MCLLFMANHAHPRYRLIVAANRDEFHARPTAPLAWWKDHPHLLAGRDLEQGGTWAGVARDGRFSAVTNFREPGVRITGAPSRGLLVSEFLTGTESARTFAGDLARRASACNGFNLVLGDGEELIWFSNRGEGSVVLEPGLYGLSNHLLDTPWPKITGGLDRFRACVELDGDELIEQAFTLLADRSVPPDDQLPETGVGLEWERTLGARFIVSPDYGTRSSSVILLNHDGGGLFVEQSFEQGRPTGSPTHFSWHSFNK